jgi:hypothetical protein
MSMVMPVVQLCVLGYAFGGNVKHLKVGIVDQDHGLPAVRVRSSAVTAGARTFETVDYADPGEALANLRSAVSTACSPSPFPRAACSSETGGTRADRGQPTTSCRRRGQARQSAVGIQSSASAQARARPCSMCRGLPVCAMHAVSAAGFDRDVDFQW